MRMGSELLFTNMHIANKDLQDIVILDKFMAMFAD